MTKCYMFEILKKKYPSYHIILIFHNQLPNFWSWETFKRSKDTVVAKHSKWQCLFNLHFQSACSLKMVMDRELASNYRLMQTHPFSISSDIVISLKHQCKQFKLTSENAQVSFMIITNDLPYISCC